MARVKIGPATRDHDSLSEEIARLRELDAGALRDRWQAVFGRKAPAHLARHLLFKILAYRIQADVLGDLDPETKRLLDGAASPEEAGKRAAALSRTVSSLRPGTILGREWSGHMHRVSVMTDGFAWEGRTYPSLSKVAHAITGTHWNGPKFFGLRDKPAKGAAS